MLIYLDAGHSGDIEPGACGNDLRECDVNLAFALALGKQLEEVYHHTVMYYRTGRVDETDLYNRVRRANRLGADLYLSIHCNAFSDSAANGVEAFYLDDSCLDAKQYATCIVDAVSRVGGMRSRGIKSANFYVLRRTDMPAVLLELGFVTNPGDSKRLSNGEWLADVALAVAKSITPN